SSARRLVHPRRVSRQYLARRLGPRWDGGRLPQRSAPPLRKEHDKGCAGRSPSRAHPLVARLGLLFRPGCLILQMRVPAQERADSISSSSLALVFPSRQTSLLHSPGFSFILSFGVAPSSGSSQHGRIPSSAFSLAGCVASPGSRRPGKGTKHAG